MWRRTSNTNCTVLVALESDLSDFIGNLTTSVSSMMWRHTSNTNCTVLVALESDLSDLIENLATKATSFPHIMELTDVVKFPMKSLCTYITCTCIIWFCVMDYRGMTSYHGNNVAKFPMKSLSSYIICTIRIRIFIIPINGPTIGANKLHTLIIVIGGNYTYTGYLVYIKIYIYIYKYNVSCLKQGLWYWNIFSLSVYIIKKFLRLWTQQETLYLYIYIYIFIYTR
jgi:hypothetical protein